MFICWRTVGVKFFDNRIYFVSYTSSASSPMVWRRTAHCVSSSLASTSLALAYSAHLCFHFRQFKAMFPSIRKGPIGFTCSMIGHFWHHVMNWVFNEGVYSRKLLIKTIWLAQDFIKTGCNHSGTWLIYSIIVEYEITCQSNIYRISALLLQSLTE